MRKVSLIVACVLLLVGISRLRQPARVVILNGGEPVEDLGIALADLDGSMRGRVDTLDLRRAHVMRLVVRFPATPRFDAVAERQQMRRDAMLMEAHARLYWARLHDVMLPSIRDTVVVTMHRGVLWDSGLPGKGHVTRNQRFDEPVKRGWYRGPWPRPALGLSTVHR